MTLAVTSGVFGSLGTDETTGVTIATTATTTSSELAAASTTAEAWINLYLKFTSTVTAGTVDVRLWSGRITAQSYSDLAPVVGSYVPTNGTQKIFVGSFTVGQFVYASVTNNATGANATNVTLGYELFKRS